ncbi:hypothetical protein ACHAXT_003641 [Thalassiosira profunda]
MAGSKKKGGGAAKKANGAAINDAPQPPPQLDAGGFENPNPMGNNPMSLMSAMLGGALPPGASMSMAGGPMPPGMPPGMMMGPVPPGIMEAMMDAAMMGGPMGGMGAMMPPWMAPGGAEAMDSIPTVAAGGGTALPKKGKKAKKDQSSQQGPAAKRKKRSASGASASTDEEPEVPIELMTEGWQKDVLDKFQRCASAEGIKDTSFFHTTTKGQAMVASASTSGGSARYRRYGASSGAASGVGNINCLRKLLAELNRMEYEDSDQLPGGTAPVWLRYDDETPQYMRAIITGPPRDTPYSNGLFTFDIYVPDSYPNAPPKVQLLTTGGGTVGFSPNLYSDGKVCLSLLNTWSGPKWDPENSSILQILVSIQGLILGVEHPYYMEPGYGGWEASHSSKAAKKAAIMNGGADLASPPPAGTSATTQMVAKMAEIKAGKGGAAGAASAAAGGAGAVAATNTATTTANPQNGTSLHSYIPLNVRRFEDNIRVGTLKYGIGEYCREVIKQSQSATAASARPNYLSAFQDIVHAHFWHRKECILADGKKWVDSASSNSQKRLMQSALKSLEAVLKQLVAPPSASKDGEDAMDTSDSGKPSAAAGEDPETAAKRKQMEAAAAKADYITAGRIQAELEVSAKVLDMIVARRKEMDEAAEKKDYVQAGKMQLIVQHLEKNRRRLQDLERRMFESAAKQDFVKAGKFQEQYRILLEDVGEGASKLSTGACAGATGKSSSVGASLGGVLASSLLGPGAVVSAPPAPVYMGPGAAGAYDPYDDGYDDAYDDGGYY